MADPNGIKRRLVGILEQPGHDFADLPRPLFEGLVFRRQPWNIYIVFQADSGDVTGGYLTNRPVVMPT